LVKLQLTQIESYYMTVKKEEDYFQVIFYRDAYEKSVSFRLFQNQYSKVTMEKKFEQYQNLVN